MLLGDLTRTLSTRLRPAALQAILWALAGALIFALLVRFLMRATGIREDIPFPGALYAVTAPFVTPFYRFFPVSSRFDYHAYEWASPVAALGVLVVSVVLYTLLLVVSDLLSHRRD